MLVIAGTVPDETFPLVLGEVRGGHEAIQVGGHSVSVGRGTPAMLAAALEASKVLGTTPPVACLAGDIGLGRGSSQVYAKLSGQAREIAPSVMAFHYLQPDVDGHNKVLLALMALEPRPMLVADAGFMYAAKMSGMAAEYDLFTPDAGELAFLADERAPHPFYTRGFILQNGHGVPDLIRRAYDHDNAARCLLVKGARDHIASGQGILATVDSPEIEAMEAMGGTGDTVTGMAAALIHAGLDVPMASIIAAKANRLAAQAAQPTPASQVAELIRHIPNALETLLP
jgi:NAD(P)H-hydrate repair Nnr-like enzyme with NAD(P)H-hydrate dehydratase domain